MAVVHKGFHEQLAQMNAELAQRVFHECPNCGMVSECPSRQQLQHSLATAFVTLQRERVPERRQQLWNQCLEFAAQLENLNDDDNNHN